MTGLMAWCQAPTRALGRFDAAQRPKTLDEMYACATNEFERQAITDMLFGSVTDVLDRYLPDREKHGALRGMLAFLAVNTTYRGPATPGSAAALAFGLAVPDENATLIKKFRGGMGAVTEHLLRHTTFFHAQAHGHDVRRPGGDCHGPIHPVQMGPNRPGPKGYVGQPIPIDGLYLASAGCHGGPGITFIPGYNAAQQVLADRG